MTTLAERVRLRCIECGDCLIWQGSSSRGKHPQIKIAGHTVSVRKALWVEKHGPVPDGMEVAQTCETRNCVEHIEAQTRKKIARRVAATGVYASPTRCAKIAAAKRESNSGLTREQAMDIRYGAGTLQEAADRHGISRVSAGCIRRGERWKEYGGVFAGLGARP